MSFNSADEDDSNQGQNKHRDMHLGDTTAKYRNKDVLRFAFAF